MVKYWGCNPSNACIGCSSFRPELPYILLDTELKVWLIDFDKCRRRKSGGWKVQNLARLKRSLDKESLKHRELFLQNAAWSALLAGYEAGS